MSAGQTQTQTQTQAQAQAQTQVQDQGKQAKTTTLLKATRAVADLYLDGIYKWLESHPEYFTPIKGAEAKINSQYWALDYEKARALLVDWYKAWRRAIQAYREDRVEKVVEAFQGRRVKWERTPNP